MHSLKPNDGFRFRMVVLADELLESFFDTDFTASFRLEPVVEAPLAQSTSGLLGGLISSIVTDDNIKMFHRITDEFGKTVGQHQVWYTGGGKCSCFDVVNRSHIVHPSEGS